MKNTTTKVYDTNDYITDENASAKKIGQTIYVATFQFNGDKNWDLASALVRLVERDISAAEPA